ncbi:hypothetical protein AA313_de0210207 [Arthrobotrys entomopaga]|nr:hypothetical protein AA313_de0210207 [Arthrobotrys entomopaga]
MLGLAIGAVIVSPFAIIYGKRPLYLAGAVIFFASAIWAALSPTYVSLMLARIVMGIGVSPCECLPSAYLSEIFYLHERGFRLGIYTLLLLGGKNLVPLVSGVIIESMGWRWVFWIVAIIIGTLIFLLFLFVPETYWVRYAHPPQRPSLIHRISEITRSSLSVLSHRHGKGEGEEGRERDNVIEGISPTKEYHKELALGPSTGVDGKEKPEGSTKPSAPQAAPQSPISEGPHLQITLPPPHERDSGKETKHVPRTPKPKPKRSTLADLPGHQPPNLKYTRHGPKASFKSQLSIYNGRLRPDSFWKVMCRPMVLFAYPAILWSTAVYSLSVVWLIVLSETVAHIYEVSSIYSTRKRRILT